MGMKLSKSSMWGITGQMTQFCQKINCNKEKKEGKVTSRLKETVTYQESVMSKQQILIQINQC